MIRTVFHRQSLTGVSSFQVTPKLGHIDNEESAAHLLPNSAANLSPNGNVTLESGQQSPVWLSNSERRCAVLSPRMKADRGARRVDEVEQCQALGWALRTVAAWQLAHVDGGREIRSLRTCSGPSVHNEFEASLESKQQKLSSVLSGDSRSPLRTDVTEKPCSHAVWTL